MGRNLHNLLRSVFNVKKRSRKMNIYITLFCVGMVLGLMGQLLLKKGMIHIGEVTLFSKGIRNLSKTVWNMMTNKTVLAGIFFFAVSSLLWLVILSGLELSYIYPLVSINYVLVALSSRVLFKEKVTKARWLSIAVIIVGVILVSSS